MRRVTEENEEGEKSEEKAVSLVTVCAGAHSRWEDDGREGVERAVVYVTAVGEVKTGSGSVC